MSINDDWRRYLEYLGYTGDLGFMLQQALLERQEEEDSDLWALSDLWKGFLGAMGYFGDVNSSMLYYLGDRGYEQSTLGERLKASLEANDFFSSVIPPIGCAFPMSGDMAPSGSLIVYGDNGQGIKTPDIRIPSQSYAAMSESSAALHPDALTVFEVLLKSGITDQSGSQTNSLSAGIIDLAWGSQASLSFSKDHITDDSYIFVSNGVSPYSHPASGSTFPLRLGLGVTDDYRIFLNYLGQWVETGLTAQPGSEYSLLTGYPVSLDPTLESGIADAEIITDASLFQNTYPEIPGITKQVDLCGNTISQEPLPESTWDNNTLWDNNTYWS